jgi:hypothetical protein
MLEKIKKWIAGLGASQQTTPTRELNQSGAHPRSKQAPPRPTRTPQDLHQGGDRRKTRDRRTQPEFVELDPTVAGKIVDNGPGKNVLVRNKYQREDTGTHETLRIVDDSLVDSGEETGIDPYNTGNFDRSKNWDKRFRK